MTIVAVRQLVYRGMCGFAIAKFFCRDETKGDFERRRDYEHTLFSCRVIFWGKKCIVQTHLFINEVIPNAL